MVTMVIFFWFWLWFLSCAKLPYTSQAASVLTNSTGSILALWELQGHPLSLLRVIPIRSNRLIQRIWKEGVERRVSLYADNLPLFDLKPAFQSFEDIILKKRKLSPIKGTLKLNSTGSDERPFPLYCNLCR